jgi:hypothetical protein
MHRQLSLERTLLRFFQAQEETFRPIEFVNYKMHRRKSIDHVSATAPLFDYRRSDCQRMIKPLQSQTDDGSQKIVAYSKVYIMYIYI